MIIGWTLILVGPLIMTGWIGDDHKRIRWRGRIVTRWAKGVTQIMGMRISVQGAPPERPFCLVANHLGYIDILLFLSQMTTVFVSKADVKDWPVMGWLATLAGTLYIDRGRKRDILRITEAMEDLIARGDGVIFFPEGTSHRGDFVHPFKPPLLDLPARLEIPVAYASVSYETPASETPASEVVCWWGDMPFGSHVLDMLKLPYFSATLIFGNETVLRSDRKALAHELHERVAAQFIPVVQQHTLNE